MIKNKKGFTLVELLAVIVILAIILVIAVPQIMKTIDNAREGALSSSAKLIAASAEREYLVRETLGDTNFDPDNVEMECSEVAETTSDYSDCDITFTNGKAYVSLTGSGKFEGKYVCNATREEATVTETACSGGNGGSGDEGSGSTESAGVAYIKNLLATAASDNGLENPIVTNGEDEYDTGIRYTGSDPKNYVWFNCEDSYEKDGQTINYGDEGYEYNETNCELWRIIGVFDVEGTKRVKIINTSSTFSASWDSSASDVNMGYGINQWGATSSYEGADLMRLLNGYYIKRTSPDYVKNENDPTTLCQYNNTSSKEGLEQECDTSTTSLSSYNMKPLTQSALGMIGSAKWYTYATNTSTAGDAYLQERGITKTYTGCSTTESSTTSECTRDGVTRENEWEGLVGLMYLSDMRYANGWLYRSSPYAWTISPRSHSSNAPNVWYARSSDAYDDYASILIGVWPSVYLNSNVEIIDGDGSSTKTTDGTGPYIIKKMSVSA